MIRGVQLLNMELLPQYYVVTVVGLLGLIIGSFLDVIVCRFNTGKSINGRSRCLSCGHALSWYELLPLVSYIVLRGRCKSCGSSIPARLLVMESVTAFMFVYVYIHAHSYVFTIFSMILVSLLIVISAYDMRHMIIPNGFVLALILLACVYLGYESYIFSTSFSLLSHAFAASGVALFFASLWFFSSGRWIGFGDVKLAFALCLFLSVEEAFSFVVLSFWVGAFVSVCILGLQKLLQSGKQYLPIQGLSLTMKSEVPFAPFMIIAFIVVFFQQANVLSIMTRLF